jgi:hypothetical protein
MPPIFFGKSFRQAGLLRDPLLGMRFKGFYHRSTAVDFSVFRKILFRQAGLLT